MIRLTYYFVIILAAQAFSCDTNNAGARNVGALRSDENKTLTAIATPDGRALTVGDVSFNCRRPELCEIEASEVAAFPLQDKDDKPDSAHPRYLSFKFRGDYGLRSAQSQSQPEVRVYSVQEFRQCLAKSPGDVQDFDNRVRDLTRLLNDEAGRPENKVPYLPFTDQVQQFVSRMTYVSFKEGKGIIYLTQFNSNPWIINNEALTYVFQGLTNDGRTYVLGRFPVKAEGLPDSWRADSSEGYVLPPHFYKPEDRRRNELEYQNYVGNVKKILNSLRPDQFQPDLKFFDELMSSIEIQK